MSEETKTSALADDVRKEVQERLETFRYNRSLRDVGDGLGTPKGLQEHHVRLLTNHLTPLVCELIERQHHKAGMVLDLSELPPECDVEITRDRTGWYIYISDLAACRTESRSGSTPAEAYDSALKAWRENGRG